MPRFFDPLLKIPGRCNEHELLAQIQFLNAENQITRRRLPKCIVVTPIERRRLLRFGQVLRWSVLQRSISIVTPRTFARWARGAKPYPRDYERRGKKVGRPPTPQPIREVVIRIARETGLGYTRIQGEDLVRPDLASMLTRLAQDGRDFFFGGIGHAKVP